MLSGIDLWLRRLLADNFIVRSVKKNTFMVMLGPVTFQSLSAAVQFDLFTLLGNRGPLRRSEIARSLNISEKSARSLLALLVATDLIKQKNSGQPSDPVYKNSFVAQNYLNSESRQSITSLVNMYQHIFYKGMHHYYDSLKASTNLGLQEVSGTEPTLDQRLAHHPALEKIFQSAMQQLSSQANPYLAKYVDFSASKHLLDIGGGNASNVIQIVRKHKQLKGTVFDSLTVSERARQNILEKKLSERIDVVGGDCFADSWPQGVDTVLFCHFLHLWPEEQCEELLKKAYNALPVGGRLIIFDVMEWDDGTGPLPAVATSALFLTVATQNGYMYAAREYENWLQKSDFKILKKLKLPDDHVAIIAGKS